MADFNDETAGATRKPDQHASMRRRVLLAAAGTALGTALPWPKHSHAAGQRTLKVSTYGGYFERMFAEHVHPAFTRATGIAVTSIEQSEGAQFLFQLAAADRSGQPPMDVCCAGAIDVLRGRAINLWHPLDPARVPNAAHLPQHFLGAGRKGLDSVAAMSWYMTLVVSPEELRSLPDSWAVLWGSSVNTWGVMTGSQSPIFEVAANLYFGGNEILMRKDGIDAVIAKIGQLKRNVKLWWQDEGSMQTALLNDDVAGGTYMHDTAMVMARSGTPVRSIFPKEGAVESTNYWCVPNSSTKVAEAHEFINFCCTPEAQELIARYVGSAPVLDHSRLRLTAQELSAVCAPNPSIRAATEARFQFTDYMEREFTRMVTS
jgi:putative spermidine/putrescine transport system substrate-binding protein